MLVNYLHRTLLHIMEVFDDIDDKPFRVRVISP